jgi:hypothetical protein
LAHCPFRWSQINLFNFIKIDVVSWVLFGMKIIVWWVEPALSSLSVSSLFVLKISGASVAHSLQFCKVINAYIINCYFLCVKLCVIRFGLFAWDEEKIDVLNNIAICHVSFFSAVCVTQNIIIGGQTMTNNFSFLLH